MNLLISRQSKTHAIIMIYIEMFLLDWTATEVGRFFLIKIYTLRHSKMFTRLNAQPNCYLPRKHRIQLWLQNFIFRNLSSNTIKIHKKSIGLTPYFVLRAYYAYLLGWGNRCLGSGEEKAHSWVEDSFLTRGCLTSVARLLRTAVLLIHI